MKITRLVIKNYRGIRKLDIKVPPAGAVIKGANAKGKTSVLKAIAAAISNDGAGADAVRIGEDASEILVDVDALEKLHIARRITAKGSSSVTVTTSDGDKWAKPQTRLTEMFGGCALDALHFFLAEPKDRRRLILDAIPNEVTAKDIDGWTNGGAEILGFAKDFVAPNGLEIVGQLREKFYNRRTEANRVAKEARGRASEATDAADAGTVKGTRSVEDAQTQVDGARARVGEIRGRSAAQEAMRQSGEKTRATIKTLLEQAEQLQADAMPDPSEKRMQLAVGLDRDATDRVDRLRAQLEVAEAEQKRAALELKELIDQAQTVKEQRREIANLRRRAEELEQTIPATAVGTEEEFAGAQTALETAEADLEHARQAERWRGLVETSTRLTAEATGMENTADALDEIVKTLTTKAPRELAQRANLIEGLAFDGDQITMDGVAIDALSGAEQMRFAVEIARRLNAKAKILVVDGLERLDGERLGVFVKLATADGWQLLATKVTDGELVVDAIES